MGLYCFSFEFLTGVIISIFKRWVSIQEFFHFRSKSGAMVYSPKVNGSYLWTHDWNIFHLCKSITSKSAYGCQKVSKISLTKSGDYFWPKNNQNLHFEKDQSFYNIDMKSKEEIMHEKISQYVEDKCNKFSNLSDWLKNVIHKDAILLTTHKVYIFSVLVSLNSEDFGPMGSVILDDY